MSIRKRKWKTAKGLGKEAWVVDYVDTKGVRRLKTFAKKKDADAFASKADVEVREGIHVADSDTITVKEAGSLWLKTCARLERSTIDQYTQHVELHIAPLIGASKLSKITAADGTINQQETEFLQKWLAANCDISDQPVIRTLYKRVNEILGDGILDIDEHAELLDTLNSFSNRDFELGEILKPTTLPLCKPAPNLTFAAQVYCFTGTFNYGQRKHCESAVTERGGFVGGLTQKTEILVIGAYATESWKHSSFGNKIIQAADWRDAGRPISIVTEEHWVRYL